MAVLAVLALVLTANFDHPRVAAGTTIMVNDSCTLPDAIRAANTDTAVGGCPAGSGADVIVLPQGAVFTFAEGTLGGAVYGPSALLITQSLTIEGNGATIRRVVPDRQCGDIPDGFLSGSTDTKQFRLILIQGGGSLGVVDVTIKDLTIEGGCTWFYGPGPAWFRYGAAVEVRNAGLRLEGVTLRNNKAVGGGGALGIDSLRSVQVVNSTIENNVSDGIYQSGSSVTLSGVTIRNNTGRGINGATRFVAERVRIEGNEAGGAFVWADTQFKDSTIANNTGGPGIIAEGPVTVVRSTIAGNSAPCVQENPQQGIWNQAGGIHLRSGGLLTIVNSTISGNQSCGRAGGIELHNTGNLTMMVDIAFSTIVGNSGSQDSAGGIATTGFEAGGRAVIRVRNSIFANNGANCLLSGPPDRVSLQVGGANFSTDQSCTGFTEVAQGSLALAPLAENGGPTPTHALGQGSSAIDAVPPSECTDWANSVVRLDQRRLGRPAGSQCDAGSYEFGATEAPIPSLTVSVPGTPPGGNVASNDGRINCGSGGNACSAAYDLDPPASVTLTATPDAGYILVGWSGDCSGDSPSVTLTMDTSKTCTAQFSNQVTLNVQKQGAGSGRVTSNPAGIDCGQDCSEVYQVGTQVVLTATPDQGSVFIGWSGSCSGINPTTTVTMNGNKTCTATFQTSVTLTVQISGGGTGTVSSNPTGISCPPTCTAQFLSGSTVSLTAAAGQDSFFTGWSGDCSGSSPTTAVQLTGNKTCTANFSPAQTLLFEDFSGGIPSTWQVVDGGSGGGNAATWTTSNPGDRDIGQPFTSPFAIVDSDAAGESATQDEQLITPSVSIATCLGQGGRIFLTFSNQFPRYDQGLDEKADVDVSTDGANWTNVLRMRGQDDGYPTPNTKSVELTSHLQGATSFRIRFHYYDAQFEWWWAIDNVRVVCVGVTGGGGGNGGGGGGGGPALPPEPPPPPPSPPGEVTVTSPTGSGALTFQVASGATPASFQAQPFTGMPAVPVPAGYELPHGLYSLTVGGLPPGASITVQVKLPSPIPVGAVWLKLLGGSWVPLPVGDDDGDDVITFTLTDGGQGDADGVENGVIADPGGPAIPRPQQQPTPTPPTAPPAGPGLVSLWPCGEGVACISFQPSQGATSYRLESALEPGFSFGLNSVEVDASALLWGNTIVVGMPTGDMLSFYYRLSACNGAGCSGAVFVGGMAARRFPAGTSEHWAFVVGGYRFLGVSYGWAQSQVSVPGKVSELHLYDGVQGYGGTRVHSCSDVQPGESCSWQWASGDPWLSGSQEFPPYGEVGVAVRVG